LVNRTLRLKTNGLRLITTIHDVVFKQFPESYPFRERWYADHATRLAVRHADRIIVPTQAVKEDLERHYRCSSEKAVVIHHGVDSGQWTVDSADHRAPSTVNCQLSTPYLLYVGRLERKKNVARMVEAFTRVALQHPDLRLVLAGPPGHGYEEVRAAIDRSPVRDHIVEAGWVDQRQYHQLLSTATVFLFPTLGEGFGLPILEAMAAGVPVITSRGSAHEEVSGGAAMLVSPQSTDEIACAMDCLLLDEHLRAYLVQRGQHRAVQFTWNRTAEQTWGVLRDVLLI
jgi:glycosyltransferase involved in cell wall biosynthesis